MSHSTHTTREEFIFGRAATARGVAYFESIPYSRQTETSPEEGGGEYLQHLEVEVFEVSDGRVINRHDENDRYLDWFELLDRMAESKFEHDPEELTWM